jgi:inosine triphosphate pyrophosphatase
MLCYDWLVFVTGNANKLKEVQAILATGDRPVKIESRNLDSEISFLFSYVSAWEKEIDSDHFVRFASFIATVPEIQGTTQEVAKAKCRAAAEQV